MRTLALAEDDRYFYDPAAAERPIRFIERYLTHYEGRFAGDSFRLLDWQKDQVIRPLFGWRRRGDGLRRFRELFLLTAKGAGKTPLLTGLGLYMLLLDGEAAPFVVSFASTFDQANLTFDAAKQYIAASRPLSRRCVVKQYKIVVPRGYGRWVIISGKPTGRSGSRPSCIIGDEAHEWLGPTAQAFRLITANLFKRAQPLLLVATNAPTSSATICRQLYDRAVAVLEGSSREEALLPVLYEAPRELEWSSEEAARAANPSIPAIVKFEQLAPQVQKAASCDEELAEYRRLYLSQQTQSAGRWLPLELWDPCMPEAALEIPPGAPVYVGLDLSQNDDLSAAVFVFMTENKMLVEAKFWLPRITAERYDADGIPYLTWSAAGHLELGAEPTISPAVKRAIAAAIIARCAGHDVQAVCYDRYKADECIAVLEAAGLICVPIGQGWGVARGTEELERRLKDQSLRLAYSPLLRAMAEQVEVATDSHGNRWPVKPGRTAASAGKRSVKIDGIAALVTALTEAVKFSFPARTWRGEAFVVSSKK